MRARRTVTAVLAGACALLLPAVPGASADGLVAGDASVSFPLAVPASTTAALRQLAATNGRPAAVRALAPAPDRARAVVRWADRWGFRVVSRSPWLVEVRGSAADLAIALGTRATSTRADGRAVAHAVGPLHVPAALRGLVTTPVGLDERPTYRHHGYGGGDLQVMHDLPVRGSGAGADTAVGTLNLSGWHPADLAEFVASYGLRAPAVTNVLVGGGHVLATEAEDASDDQSEVALDVEAIAGTAPAAAQRMYFGDNTDADFLAILSRMADDAEAGLLQTASSSWGLCEALVGATERQAESTQIDRMVAAGATFFAASGDSGSYGCSSPDAPDTGLAVDWPASQPATVGVGGTSVSGTAATGYDAKGWGSVGAPQAGVFAGHGSGGGCSADVGQPSYQASLTVCPGAVRAVPDMAALADPATGFPVFTSVDGWTLVGGTSLAAPVAAAGLAGYLSSQSDKHGLGNVLPAAYSHPTAFTDVVAGSNGHYQAGTGYDAVTGLGVPDWRLLGAAVRNVPAPPVAASSSNPWFSPRSAWNDRTVPFGTGLNGGSLTGIAVRAGDDHTCRAGGELAVSGDGFVLPDVADGPQAVTLSGLDPGMGCRATTRTVFLDRAAPALSVTAAYVGVSTARYALSWAVHDTAPSSGLDGYDVTVTDTSQGTTALSLFATTSTGASFTGLAGHSYALAVQVFDRAGNASSTVTRTFRAPYDDRSASLSRRWTGSAYVSDWSRATSASDYGGSHVLTSRPSASLVFRVTGRTFDLGIVQGRYGGYADVFVDGVRKVRFSCYASSTRYRRLVRVTSFARAGAHTVLVTVVGAHPSGSLGNAVYVDSLRVGS